MVRCSLLKTLSYGTYSNYHVAPLGNRGGALPERECSQSHWDKQALLCKTPFQILSRPGEIFPAHRFIQRFPRRLLYGRQWSSNESCYWGAGCEKYSSQCPCISCLVQREPPLRGVLSTTWSSFAFTYNILYMKCPFVKNETWNWISFHLIFARSIQTKAPGIIDEKMVGMKIGK